MSIWRMFVLAYPYLWRSCRVLPGVLAWLPETVGRGRVNPHRGPPRTRQSPAE